ncbi:MAG: hypothetical protein K9L21_05065, partial [Spirochaetia bacterium]|nr:hypothetical protein [Spirochaetia bacterium]
VTLSTAAHMNAEQADWPDEDPSKNVDFYSCLYWVTTDNGIDPIGIDSAQDLIEAVAESLGWDRIVAASAMGSAKGGKKAETARENGKKGGRPKRMLLYIYSRDVEIEELTSSDLVDVIKGTDNADCEAKAADYYDSNDYYWTYTEV